MYCLKILDNFIGEKDTHLNLCLYEYVMHNGHGLNIFPNDNQHPNVVMFVLQTRSRKKRCILVIFLLVIITIVALIIWLATQ